MENTPNIQLPKYKCHKEVWALKISILSLPNPATPGLQTIMFPEDTRFAPFELDEEYVKKHNPQPGGYYVVYADGYKSYSPAKAFEEGYTLIS